MKEPAPLPVAAAGPSPGLLEIFIAFLLIGASSFGGGVVAYLRSTLVVRKKWLDEEQFLSTLGIAQALPGLNATNMSAIVGDRLRGLPGAIVAFLGMTLPGGIAVMILGVFYASHSDHPGINAALIGVGAASVGLLSAVTLRIGQSIPASWKSLFIVATTVILISVLDVPLLIVLLIMIPLSVLLARHQGDGGIGSERREEVS